MTTLVEDRLSDLPDDTLTNHILALLSTKESVSTSVLSRRWKHLYKSGLDRLSCLPDGILTKILSCLFTKQSISTSVLSTRWKYLFDSVPTLHLDSRCPFCDRNNTAADAIYKFSILMSDFTMINRERLLHNTWSIGLRVGHQSSYVKSWIYAATRRNSQLLELEAISSNVISLPRELFTCQMLVELKLTSQLGTAFVFNGIETVSLPALKTVYLNGCIISDGDLFKRLFSSCPVLEDLTFYEFNPFTVRFFSISAPSVKRFTIHSPWGREERCTWELNVPNLEYIHCKAFRTKWNLVNDVKSLHKANICLLSSVGVFDDSISELVNKFDEVQFLTLRGFSLESLFASRSFSLPMLNKLTTLELEVSSCKGWMFFQQLLEKSPCLELLVILENGFLGSAERITDINVLFPKDISLCFSRSLKELKFYEFEGGRAEYEWLGYLLKYAKVLEKLTISLMGDSQSELFKNLFVLPRGSKTCEIVVEA